MATELKNESAEKSTADVVIPNYVKSTGTPEVEAALEPPRTGNVEPLPAEGPREAEAVTLNAPEGVANCDALCNNAHANDDSTDKSTACEAEEPRRRKNLRNRRKQANKHKRRVPKEPRVKLTAEEREHVCALLRDFHKHPEPILRTARRNIEKDSRSSFLSPEDKDEIIGAFALRVHTYLHKFLEAVNPWALLKTVVGRCIYDYLKPQKHHLRVTFRRRARIRSLIKRLRLNKADIISDTRDKDGKRILEIWATTAQVKELRSHDQVESLVVLHNNVNVVSIEDVDIADPADAARDWEILEDIKTAHRILQPEMEKPAAVFDLFVFQKLRLGEVAKLLGLSVRWCRELLRKFIRRMVERFSELKEDLVKILMQIW